MAFERTLEGKIVSLDRSSKTIRVIRADAQGGHFQGTTVSLTLGPNVSVVSRTRGALKLAALKIGQEVLVHYVTESGERTIAHSIAVIDRSPEPSGGFPGVRVAV